MKVGILGSGDVAKALAAGFLGRKDEVKLGTRDPGKPELAAWLAGKGRGATVGSFEDSARFGEWVVIATRGVANAETIHAAGPKSFSGKVVLDVTNPLVFHPDGPPSLAVGFSDSAGEQVQRALPDAKVVKVFNTSGSPHMVHPRFPGGPPDMFLCGKDDGAKKAVAKIVKEFGWNPEDIGGIEGARLLEPLTILWVTVALRRGNWDNAWRLLQK
ncbi:MAG TPA: NAD(P)-binding domain-containing protein [Thermoplasmata archaeon]|nr:NAD(P)-binding domain-containing protein [Thermoplasmata archaeon]